MYAASNFWYTLGMEEIHTRPIQKTDKQWITQLLSNAWGSAEIVSRGKKLDASILPGFVASIAEKLVGIVTYNMYNQQCEIVSLNSLIEGKGIGTKLIDAVKNKARE